MARRAMVTCSPVDSMTSNSRPSGWGDTSLARVNNRLVSPLMAETTTTTWLPWAFQRAIRLATFRMRSGDPTEVPPYFWTIKAIGKTDFSKVVDYKQFNRANVMTLIDIKKLCRGLVWRSNIDYAMWYITSVIVFRLMSYPTQLSTEDNHMKANDKIDAREIRRKLGMNQQQFWSKLGVTQSGGSRYESGRNMPRPVQHLLRLVHVEQIDITKVKREDFEVVEYLKSHKSEQFKALKKEARAAQKK